MSKFSFDEFQRGLTEGIRHNAARPNINGYVPHDIQTAFHSSNARGKLYIGGNRSGKTVGGATEAIWWCSKRHPYRNIGERYPETIRGRAVGVDFTNGIEKILKPEVKRWITPSMLINGSWEESFNNNTKTLTFSNGSFLEFMSYDQELDKFAGTSRHFTWFDEEPPKTVFGECVTRLADTEGDWWMTMTPVEGISWVYFDIYEPWKLQALDKIDVFEINTNQNPHVREEAIDFALSFAEEEERVARKQGKFVFMTGLIFDKWSPNIHVVKPPPLRLIQNPRNRIMVGMDPGLRIGSFTWHLVSPTGRVVTFHECTQKNWTVQQYADYFHEYNEKIGRKPELIVGDPAIRQRNAVTGNSIQVEYALRNVFIAEGNNNVDVGINKMKQYIGIPGSQEPMWTISEDCHMLIKNMQRYRWDEWATKKQAEKNDVKQTPKKKDDHDIDSVRYFFSHMPDLKFNPSKPVPSNHEALKLVNPVTTYDPDMPVRNDSQTYETIWTQVDSDIGEF